MRTSLARPARHNPGGSILPPARPVPRSRTGWSSTSRPYPGRNDRNSGRWRFPKTRPLPAPVPPQRGGYEPQRNPGHHGTGSSRIQEGATRDSGRHGSSSEAPVTALPRRTGYEPQRNPGRHGTGSSRIQEGATRDSGRHGSSSEAPVTALPRRTGYEPQRNPGRHGTGSSRIQEGATRDSGRHGSSSEAPVTALPRRAGYEPQRNPGRHGTGSSRIQEGATRDSGRHGSSSEAPVTALPRRTGYGLQRTRRTRSGPRQPRRDAPATGPIEPRLSRRRAIPSPGRNEIGTAGRHESVKRGPVNAEFSPAGAGAGRSRTVRCVPPPPERPDRRQHGSSRGRGR